MKQKEEKKSAKCIGSRGEGNDSTNSHDDDELNLQSNKHASVTCGQTSEPLRLMKWMEGWNMLLLVCWGHHMSPSEWMQNASFFLFKLPIESAI